VVGRSRISPEFVEDVAEWLSGAGLTLFFADSYQRQNWWRQRVFRFLDAPTSDSLKGWLPPVTWTHSPRRN
jgi:hypothetical protein